PHDDGDDDDDDGWWTIDDGCLTNKRSDAASTGYCSPTASGAFAMIGSNIMRVPVRVRKGRAAHSAASAFVAALAVARVDDAKLETRHRV
ncbi:MAG: hypothetical protein ACKPKO_61410, partial [Candidatus Fonsibacter sp.]